MSAYAEDESSAVAEEEVIEYDTIEQLQEMGVNAQDIKRLKEAGINTVQALFMQTRKAGAELPYLLPPRTPPSPCSHSLPLLLTSCRVTRVCRCVCA